MGIAIITEPFQLNIYGFSGVAINKDHAGTAFKLMDRMWSAVRLNKLSNKGINIWVYEPADHVFAGVELNEEPDEKIGLEQKKITLPKYAYYKHVGAYNLIKIAGQQMTAEVKARGYETTLPYIELYGHWSNDDTKLETELLMCLK